MKLKNVDRLNIKLLLPRQANISDQIIARDILVKIDFKQSEIKTIVKDDVVSYTWEKDEEIEVEFTQPEIYLLKQAVKTLDSKKEITIQNLDVCLKIQAIPD